MGRRLAGVVAILVGTVLLFNIIVDVGARVFYVGFLRDGPEQSVQAEPNPETLDASGEDVEEDVRGAQIFAEQCAACHGGEGQGGFGPTLAGNDDLEDAPFVVARILNGGGGMPAFARLSDERVAAVASYVRSSWGNAFGPVAAGEVARQR